MNTKMVIIGAMCVAYITAFLPLLILPEGSWLIILLAASSWPLFLVAVAVAFVFANHIEEHPWRWATAASASALLLACLALQWFAGEGRLGLFGLPIAVLAPPIFIWSLKVFTPSAQPGDS